MGSIIPEPQQEKTEELTVLRRMPADGLSGKTGYCQPGGVIASKVDLMEEAILAATNEDLVKVKELLALENPSKNELILALGFLYQSARAAVDVAQCRGERLA